MNKKILLFSRDPGGANTIIPLINILDQRGYNIFLYGKDSSLNTYQKYCMNGRDISKELPAFNMESVVAFLKREMPDFIITGTSADDFTEKYLWKAAKILGIPSFAILDQWINYGIRFSDYHVNEMRLFEKDRHYAYLPSRILVMDNLAKKEAVEEGINEELILVTGQPYFDFLLKNKNDISSKDIHALRTRFGCCSTKDILLTYASEPISKIYGESDTSEHYWGYTERTIFRELKSALGKINNSADKNIVVVIRLHPKQNETDYYDLVEDFHNERITFAFDRYTDGLKLIQASDCIIGMSSMFLIESVILGKPIISVQIGLKRKNPFVLDRNGEVKSVLDTETLHTVLKEIALNQNYPQVSNVSFHEGAAERVVQKMEEMLCRS